MDLGIYTKNLRLTYPGLSYIYRYLGKKVMSLEEGSRLYMLSLLIH